jgi:peptidoglycan/LPS O-acetylase OafA/YrhL
LLAFGLAQFLAGILWYRAYRAEWLDRWWRRHRVCLVRAAGCLAPVAIPKTDLGVIAALGALLLACVHTIGRAKTLLDAPLLQFLGAMPITLSMLLYLIGTLVAGRLGSYGMTGVPALALMLSAAVGGATLTSRYIEFPRRDLIGRWVRQPSSVA